MDLADFDLDSLVSELDARRLAMNLSYQNVADACCVSQSTIIRFFKRDGDPAVGLLQKVIAAVQYEYVPAPIPPINPTPEEQGTYLQSLVEYEREDKRIRLAQQEANHNRQHREDVRGRRVQTIISVVLAAFICAIFAYDITHPDRGWFQAASNAGLIQSGISRAFLSVRLLWRSLWIL